MKRVASSRDQRAEHLGRCSLFSGLSPSDLLGLAGFTSLREYEPGEVLFHPAASADGFHVTIEGQVKVCRFGADGREQVLHLFGPGEACGEVPMFHGRRYPAGAFAVGSLRTLYVPRDKFVAFCKSKPEILLNMLAVLSVRLRHFVQLVEDLSLKEVSARLAKHLLDLSARSGGSLDVRLETSKSVLASRLGTVAETLSRTLGRMQRKGILRVRRGKVTIVDPSRLQALAAGMKL